MSAIQVIDRAAALLTALAHQSEPQTLRTLAEQTGLHPASAHRILAALQEHHWVERQGGGYQLGLRWLEWGQRVRSRLEVRTVALPHLRALSAATGETVNLIIRQGDEAVYIERVSGEQAMMRVVQLIGARAPLHVTAVGKLFLADSGPGGIQAYATRTGLPRYTEHTLTHPDALLAEISQIAQTGVAYDRGEAETGVACVGAGVRDAEGKLVAGVSISAPSERLKPAWTEAVRQTAAHISQALGFQTELG